jgi:SAM-dependent methyltransferase
MPGDAATGSENLMPVTRSDRPSLDLRRQLGDLDIYLFDQILRGRFDARRRLLDAGCGGGRNLIWFLQRGYDVCACDREAAAVAAVRELSARLAPSLPSANIRQGALDALPWPDADMDAVLSSAVLHFAADEGEFERMLRELWRVLRPGGLLFARLASSIGIDHLLARPTGRVRLPDGSDRFVVSERMLLEWTDRLDADLVDPIKTTNVQGLRCMTTWCLEKRGVTTG